MNRRGLLYSLAGTVALLGSSIRGSRAMASTSTRLRGVVHLVTVDPSGIGADYMAPSIEYFVVDENNTTVASSGGFGVNVPFAAPAVEKNRVLLEAVQHDAMASFGVSVEIRNLNLAAAFTEAV